MWQKLQADVNLQLVLGARQIDLLRKGNGIDSMDTRGEEWDGEIERREGEKRGRRQVENS